MAPYAETLDKLYLEWSQFTTARTNRELAAAGALTRERMAIADRAREIAGHYQEASDGRNTFVMFAEWVEDRIPKAEEREPPAREIGMAAALRQVLAALVATTSILIRAEDMKKQPSKAVASDAMFAQMLKDYDAATIAGRVALIGAESTASPAPKPACQPQQLAAAFEEMAVNPKGGKMAALAYRHAARLIREKL